MSDLSVTAANVARVTSGSNQTQVKTGTAGGTITAGQVLYANTSGNLVAAQADAASTDEVAGIALHGASSGQPIAYAIGGDLNPGATVVVGMVYALSAAAAGGIAPYADLTSGQYVSFLGVGITASNLRLGIINSGIAKP